MRYFKSYFIVAKSTELKEISLISFDYIGFTDSDDVCLQAWLYSAIYRLFYISGGFKMKENNVIKKDNSFLKAPK